MKYPSVAKHKTVPCQEYAHLTADERDRIADLKADGLSFRAIAWMSGRAVSTISRELRRNNDTCFARHMLLHGMLSATTFFCDAYASLQKGGVENANGRIRRWLPRGMDLDEIGEA